MCLVGKNWNEIWLKNLNLSIWFVGYNSDSVGVDGGPSGVDGSGGIGGSSCGGDGGDSNNDGGTFKFHWIPTS